jgi:GNAT superfamily N-acetyltransferase
VSPSFRVRGPLAGQGAACDAVLRALPDFFAIEESLRAYVRATDDLPAFVAEEEPALGAGDGGCRGAPGDAAARRTLGILTLATHSPQAAEIQVMGVVPERWREGVGRALLAVAEGWLRERGAVYLTVKTLSATHPDPGYAETRAFYAAMGFVPLLELPGLWGPEDPCAVLLKTL